MAFRNLPLPALLLAACSAAAAQEMTVAQLLDGLAEAAHSAEASERMGVYLRQTITAALASDAPGFCPEGGQGGVDARALAAFAQDHLPGAAARPVILGYLAKEYPCR